MTDSILRRFGGSYPSVLMAMDPIFVESFSNNFSLSTSSSTKSYGRTQGAGTSRRKMTFSFWLKIVTDGGFYISAAPDTTSDVLFYSTGLIAIYFALTGSGYVLSSVTLSTSTWHHVVVQVDTANATANQRVRMWFDGTEDTSLTFSVAVTQNYDTGWGASGVAENVFIASSGSHKIDEYSRIDNQLLDPTSFATSNLPKNISGLSFGAEGEWIRFETGAASTGGQDYSGNGHDFTNTNYVDGDFTSDVPT